MMIPIEQAKSQLDQLIERLTHGEAIVITRGGTPVADLVPHALNGKAANPAESADPPPRVLGWGKGMFKMSDDFDAPLEEFREYME